MCAELIVAVTGTKTRGDVLRNEDLRVHIATRFATLFIFSDSEAAQGTNTRIQMSLQQHRGPNEEIGARGRCHLERCTDVQLRRNEAPVWELKRRRFPVTLFNIYERHDYQRVITLYLTPQGVPGRKRRGLD